jgi:3-mercaptopyruvate sulfurtransferase SseA
MSRTDVLVDADWVESHLDDPSIVLVEVDEDVSAYDSGHIKGAVRLDWKTELQDQVRRDFVDKEQFEQLMSSKGIGNDHTVVLYGGNNNWFAAYAYWYFKLYGHQNVQLLDGGRKKWELDGRELTKDVTERPKTSYTAKEQDRSIRAFRDEVVEAIGNKNLVDVPVPTSSAASSWHPRTSRRSRRSARATSRRRSTCRGASWPTTTARSRPTTRSARSTPRPVSTRASRPSRTAASASGRATAGSRCASCSESPT